MCKTSQGEASAKVSLFRFCKNEKKKKRGLVAVTVSRKQIDAVLFGYKCTFAINLLFTSKTQYQTPLFV